MTPHYKVWFSLLDNPIISWITFLGMSTSLSHVRHIILSIENLIINKKFYGRSLLLFTILALMNFLVFCIRWLSRNQFIFLTMSIQMSGLKPFNRLFRNEPDSSFLFHSGPQIKTSSHESWPSPSKTWNKCFDVVDVCASSDCVFPTRLLHLIACLWFMATGSFRFENKFIFFTSFFAQGD